MAARRSRTLGRRDIVVAQRHVRIRRARLRRRRAVLRGARLRLRRVPVPPNFVAGAQDTQHFKAFEVEGKRVPSITRRCTVFYDALGPPFAKGERRTQ